MLLNPLHRVLKAYDRAIGACESQSFVAAYRSIGMLRASLQLDSPHAIGFDGIFEWCENAVGEGNFEAPARHLRALRDAWAAVDSDATSRPSTRSTPKSETVMLQFGSAASNRARA